MLKCKNGIQPPKKIHNWQFRSDMSDPQVATKQILSIVPIVQGQKESSQFQIPPHHPSN
jgi:hypothetical protein